jgi:hypothetical protein
VSRIDNTTKRMQDPAEKLLFLADAMGHGSDGAIKNQERDGQRQLVNSDHAMWSYLVDELGRERVSIFYKAAFYDRSAHMSLTSLGSYVRNSVEYDGPAVIFDDQWATREAVATALAGIRDAKLKEASEFRGYAADAKRRDENNRNGCAGIATEREAQAAKYEAAIAALAES